MGDVLPGLPFVAAKWQKPGRQGKAPRLIVLHSTESNETAKGAENVARYFTTADRPGSSHVVVDSDSIVRCVHDADTAYGAAGANNDGLHVEQVGYAAQTAADWTDPFSLAMFAQAGQIIRAWSDAYGIPLVWLTRPQVADGVTRGLCTHGDVSAAFPAQSTGHTDPGPNYPKDRALAIWRGSDDKDDDMPKCYRLAADCTIDGTKFAAGYTVLMIGNVRRHLSPGADYDETVRQWGIEDINVVAFGHLIAATALDMLGMRSIPPHQWSKMPHE